MPSGKAPLDEAHEFRREIIHLRGNFPDAMHELVISQHRGNGGEEPGGRTTSASAIPGATAWIEAVFSIPRPWKALMMPTTVRAAR